MENNNNQNSKSCCKAEQFDEKAKMTDLLDSQKHITGVYNSYLCESSDQAVKSCLEQLLQDEHRIQQVLFEEMSTRGWYKTEKAEDTKVNETKMKFSSSVSM
ncbi:MAG: spore coat protein [Clostridia bacterium]|nr:spore coat protein [Clostridia bacterium]MEE1115911.1 spore coat protein [Clostridia bacterium]